MAIATFALSSCCEMAQQPPTAMTIKNELSADEIANGKLSASAMWKMGRLGSMSLSPDAKYLVYNVTTYNMAENKGTSQIFVLDPQSGESKCLTDGQSSNNTAQWSSDSKSIYFLSDRSGENQLWKMGAAGENPVQITTVEGGIEAYGINAAADKIFYTRKVHVADRKSSDIHKDMDKSKARIYDDLMARHWDYWDEGYYSHIFVAELTAEGLKNDKDMVKTHVWESEISCTGNNYQEYVYADVICDSFDTLRAVYERQIQEKEFMTFCYPKGGELNEAIVLEFVKKQVQRSITYYPEKELADYMVLEIVNPLLCN